MESPLGGDEFLWEAVLWVKHLDQVPACCYGEKIGPVRSLRWSTPSDHQTSCAGAEQ